MAWFLLYDVEVVTDNFYNSRQRKKKGKKKWNNQSSAIMKCILTVMHDIANITDLIEDV